MTQTSFTKLEQCLADIQIWKKDIASSAVATPDEVRAQFMHNVAPMLEAMVKASMHEFGEAFEALEDMGGALDEVIGREGDFLQPEMASDLTATLLLGLFIIDFVKESNIELADELKNRKLQDATKLYRQNATILLEQIKAVTVEDEDEDEEEESDDNDDDNDEEAAPIIHGEGGGAALDGGAGAVGLGAAGGGSGDRSVNPEGPGVLGGAAGAGAGAGASESEGA